jgi:hypothetical protein
VRSKAKRHVLMSADLAPTLANVLGEQLAGISLELDNAANHHEQEAAKRHRRLSIGADDAAMVERARSEMVIHTVTATVLRELAGTLQAVGERDFGLDQAAAEGEST